MQHNTKIKDLAIYGAGGFGREVFHLIGLINKRENRYNVIGFFDDGKEKGSHNGYAPILGGMDELNAWPTPLSIVFAIGSPRTLKLLTSKVVNPLIDFPNIIAPDIVSYGNVEEKLGHGNVVCLGCVLSCDVKLGNFNMLNGFITVGHDTRLGNCNVIMPGARISGEMVVGNGNLFGANSFVLQQVKIGNDITLTPCSALLRRPKDGNTYVGNPATIMKY